MSDVHLSNFTRGRSTKKQRRETSKENQFMIVDDVLKKKSLSKSFEWRVKGVYLGIYNSLKFQWKNSNEWQLKQKWIYKRWG